MATWSIKRFDSEFEEQENRQIVPLCQELKERCEKQIPFEQAIKEKDMKAEVQRDMENQDPNFK